MKELIAFFRLAAPVAVVQLGMMLMGVVDVMMVGRTTPAGMAAINIGHTYTFMLCAMGMGLLMALDPIIAQAHGAKDNDAIALGVQRGLILAIVLSLPLTLAVLPIAPLLLKMRQVDTIVPIARDYAFAIAPGMPFFLLFVVLRQTLQSMQRLRPILITIAIANLINVVLNSVFVFGSLPIIGPLGFVPMGPVGSGYASSISRFWMAAMLLALGWPVLGPYLRRPAKGVLSVRPLLKMVTLGAPIGVQVSAEVGAFSMLNFMVGSIGVLEASGSSVVLNLASITFMIPLGISAAAAIRVGFAIGQDDQQGVRRAAAVALSLGAGFMLLTGTSLAVFREPLARLYTPDAEVIAVAASLLPIAAMFQVFDGLQVVSTGVLRGAGETLLPMLVHLSGFWLVGIPLSAYLGFYRGAPNAAGVWTGLALALTVVGCCLVLRVIVRVRRRFERVRVDIPHREH